MDLGSGDRTRSFDVEDLSYSVVRVRAISKCVAMLYNQGVANDMKEGSMLVIRHPYPVSAQPTRSLTGMYPFTSCETFTARMPIAFASTDGGHSFRIGDGVRSGLAQIRGDDPGHWAQANRREARVHS